jgi:hypothetical protein
MSPSEPPYNDEEPEDNNEEYDVPQPSAPLSCGHVVHSSERSAQNAARLGKGVVLTHRIIINNVVEGRKQRRTISLSCFVDSRTSFPIPIVICSARREGSFVMRRMASGAWRLTHIL